MTDRPGIFRSSYTKMIVGSVLAFAGIVSGIYVGYSITLGNTAKHQEPAPLTGQAAKPWVTYNPGDAFPLEPFVDSAGKSGNFEGLLKDKNTIVIFASWECGPCMSVLRYAHDKMLMRLKKGVQVVVVAEKNRGHLPDEYKGLMKGIPVVYVDGPYWTATYHQAMWPTLVGVDNSGIVLHIQFGYADAIDHELVEAFFASN